MKIGEQAREKMNWLMGNYFTSANRAECQRIMTFLAIGALNTIVGVTLFIGLYLIGVPEVFCNLTAVIAGVASSLILHHRFSNKSWSFGMFTLRFGFSATISYLVNLGSYSLLSSLSLFHPALTNIIATTMYSICFYSLMNFAWNVSGSLKNS